MSASRKDATVTSWYVLQAKAHHEAFVEKQLAQVAEDVFSPRMTATVRAGRHVQQRVVPMFPTYLFAKTDLAERGKGIRYTPGVRDFVRLGGVPEPVAPEIIAFLRERTGPSGIFVPPPRRFDRGERLRIEGGPFDGLEVIFEEELSAAGRVAVLLAQVELAARVVLDRKQLATA